MTLDIDVKKIAGRALKTVTQEPLYTGIRNLAYFGAGFTVGAGLEFLFGENNPDHLIGVVMISGTNALTEMEVQKRKEKTFLWRIPSILPSTASSSIGYIAGVSAMRSAKYSLI